MTQFVSSKMIVCLIWFAISAFLELILTSWSILSAYMYSSTEKKAIV